MIGGPGITDSRDCCVYLIDGRNELALVDSGLGYYCKALTDNINKLGLDNTLLKYVIATHGHIDHIGGLSYFKEMGVKITCHRSEINSIAIGYPELTAEAYYRVKYKPVTIDIVLTEENQSMQIGDLTLNCPHTPGHTPGGISPYVDIQGTRILFGQDIHGPFDASWGSDLKKWKRSMNMLLELKADILCEGHYGIYTPAAKVREYIELYLKKFG